MKHKDKRSIVFIAKKLIDLGFKLVATHGTASVLRKNGIPVRPVLKVYDGRPNVVDLIRNNEIDLVINTPTGNHQKCIIFFLIVTFVSLVVKKGLTNLARRIMIFEAPEFQYALNCFAE